MLRVVLFTLLQKGIVLQTAWHFSFLQVSLEYAMLEHRPPQIPPNNF